MNDWSEPTAQHQQLVLYRDEQSIEPHQPNRTDVISHDVYIWALIDGFLVVAILSGNILTILAVRFSRRLRSLISNLFILSLAISDMVVGLTLPYHLAFYLGIGLGDNKFLCILRFFLLILACCVSIWNLIAIAVDRYIAICYPLHYSRFMTKKVALILLSAGWLLGFGIAVVPLFWNKWDTAGTCEFDEVLHPWYVAGIITPVFSLVWICLLTVYWRIWREASKHAKQMRTSGLHESASDWKSVQVVLLIIGSFTLCWMPYFIVACTQIFKMLGHSSPILYKAVFSLAMANSMMNPIIYAWKNTNFRRAFCCLLKCRSPDTHETNSNRSIVHRKSSAMTATHVGATTENGNGRENFYHITSTTVNVATPNPRISGLRQCSMESRESSLEGGGGGGRDSFDDGVIIVIKNNRVFEFNNNLHISTSNDRKTRFKNTHSLSVQSNDDVISNHTTVLSFSHDTESEDNTTPKRFMAEEPPMAPTSDNLNNNYIMGNNNNNHSRNGGGSISTLTNSNTLNNSTGNILVNKCADFENYSHQLTVSQREHQTSTHGGKSAMTLSLSANSTALDCLALARPTAFDLFKNKSVECVINRKNDTLIGKVV